MPDVYGVITEMEAAIVERVAAAMEVSAADPQHRAMVDVYLADLELPEGARVLEVGCGTGAIARMVAERPGVGAVLGVDPSPLLVAKARELSTGRPRLSFAEGDGQALDVPDESFDAVVAHRMLSHVPEPEAVLAEALRVLRPGGALALFDGDYATITVATGDDDPLQACAAAFAATYIDDPWIVRRLPALARAAGFADERLRSHGYAEVTEPGYLLSILERGADALVAGGRIGPALAEAFNAEARRRAETGTFFGHIAYASLTARKPA